MISRDPFLVSPHMTLIYQTRSDTTIWLGDYSAALDTHALQKFGIRAVLTVAAELDLSYPLETGIRHKIVPVLDMASFKIRPYLSECRSFILEAMARKQNVLVHCATGISRSAANPHRLFDSEFISILITVMIRKSLIALALCVAVCMCMDPPLMYESFRIAFDESFITDKSKFIVNGKMYYDSANNRERVDRANGRYDMFCSSVNPNKTTPCTHLTVNNKRYIVFPSQRKCCECCDSAHGCGILRRDWLTSAKYEGEEKIIDTMYDKWSKDGVFGYNYFYMTKQSHIPRRLDENGTHITDYVVHSFINGEIDESIFTLPSYCKNSCPTTTICGKFKKQLNSS